MNDTFDLRGGEAHIEVHKFRAGAIIVATLLALVIQASFPVHFSRAAILDLPLLVTIYFVLLGAAGQRVGFILWPAAVLHAALALLLGRAWLRNRNA